VQFIKTNSDEIKEVNSLEKAHALRDFFDSASIHWAFVKCPAWVNSEIFMNRLIDAI